MTTYTKPQRWTKGTSESLKFIERIMSAEILAEQIDIRRKCLLQNRSNDALLV